MARLFSMLFALASLGGAGLVALPAAYQSAALLTAGDDPAAISALRLTPALTTDRIAAEADGALAAGDANLAESFVALADQHGVPVDAARRARVEQAAAGSVSETAYDFARGAVVGDVGGITGLAGAFAGDMVGIGDVRDLTREGWRAARGEEVDKLIVGLAAVGLAVTAATWGSLGETAPLRGGLSLVKKARRAGTLSRELTESVGRALAKAIDGPALERALAAAGRLELPTAAKEAARAIQPAAVAPLGAMGRDAFTLFRRADARTVEDVLAVARSPAEVGRAARLSERLGRGTRAALKVLGRGALLLGAGAWTLLGWLAAGLFYAYAVSRGARRFGERLGRRRWRRRRVGSTFPFSWRRTATPAPADARPAA
ncbi:hypothetical protein [Labrys wisconsinensis]|uniref:Uncharacterized protein n=1 Tax=Labrys wisconsinensis TaxID=425677 RepID=A0ABU0J2V6_9HYPH|nr:hypothetical protein [Labrys wisconsinensis]MDQ0467955.1 hypothetical protein [Labrys wisconsinensis]